MPSVQLSSALRRRYTRPSRRAWYRQYFNDHPGYATGDPRAFAGAGRTPDKVKTWCAPCLARRVEEVMVDDILRGVSRSKDDILTERKMHRFSSLDYQPTDCSSAVWAMEPPFTGWIQNRKSSCLRHLKGCTLQPKEVRIRAGAIVETQELEADASGDNSTVPGESSTASTLQESKAPDFFHENIVAAPSPAERQYNKEYMPPVIAASRHESYVPIPQPPAPFLSTQLYAGPLTDMQPVSLTEECPWCEHSGTLSTDTFALYIPAALVSSGNGRSTCISSDEPEPGIGASPWCTGTLNWL
jgi:hypothetical protein